LCKQSKIKLADAVIAATALTENYILVTRNIGDFKHIPGLGLLNPWNYPELVQYPATSTSD
jgi:predicted nucleic acid-binding protein